MQASAYSMNVEQCQYWRRVISTYPMLAKYTQVLIQIYPQNVSFRRYIQLIFLYKFHKIFWTSGLATTFACICVQFTEQTPLHRPTHFVAICAVWEISLPSVLYVEMLLNIRKLAPIRIDTAVIYLTWNSPVQNGYFVQTFSWEK